MFNQLWAKILSGKKAVSICITCLMILLPGLLQVANAGIVDRTRTEIIDLTLPQDWYLGEVTGLEFLRTGEMIVFNRGLHPLLVFSENGKFEREIGLGLFNVPHGLFVDNEDFIWTTDQETHQVLKFDPAGKIHLILGRKNSAGEGWFDNGYQLNLFNAPSDVALDADKNIYVADGGNYRIVKFNAHGKLVSSWGSKGTEQGLFNFPHSLVIDDKNLIYVTDRQNARIQIFNTEGEFKAQWEGIGYPYELEQFDKDTLIFTDARSGEINKIGYDGKLKESFGRWGKKESEFGFPHGLAVDKNRTIFVGELLNWRIQKFQ